MNERSRVATRDQSIACMQQKERERVHSRLALRSLLGDLHKREVRSFSVSMGNTVYRLPGHRRWQQGRALV